MRIAVNTYSLQPQPTGIGRYTSGLLRELLERSDIDDICGLSAGGLIPRAQLLSLLDTIEQPVKPQQRSWRSRLAKLPGAHRAWQMVKDHQARRASGSLEGYCYWEPSFVLMPFNGPSVATIHDLSHVHHPEFHPAYRVKALNQQLPHTYAKATRLNAVSAFTREMLQQQGVSAPVDIVSPGVDDSFFSVTEAQRQNCRQQLNLPEQYLLSVATLEPRKNLERVIAAFTALPEALRQQFPLVLAGARGWHSETIEAAINRLTEKAQAFRLGYVDQAHIPALYANASLSIYVSHYEGFGMPIAESMAAGTAVLTADRTSMPEVAGGHALLANPESVESIRQQLERLLSDPVLRDRLSHTGHTHANRFRWQHSAQHLVDSLTLAQQEYRP
ncbi:glycosyltransferase family 4 protein [Marinobacterium stanieri]|uniref:glycosyltransferase family 4 protein n=1 Tax=Marinobacterium stanieri TaxID=49186 RepID=UPI003A940E28